MLHHHLHFLLCSTLFALLSLFGIAEGQQPHLKLINCQPNSNPTSQGKICNVEKGPFEELSSEPDIEVEFEDGTLVVYHEHIIPGKGWNWQAEKGHSFTLVTVNSQDFGFFNHDGTVYDLKQDSDGEYLIRTTPQSEFSPEADGHLETKQVFIEQADNIFIRNPAPEQENTRNLNALEGILEQQQNPHQIRGLLRGGDSHRELQVDTVIDVLAVWTRQAECLASNLPMSCTLTTATETTVEGSIGTAITAANTAYANSGIPIELRLVHAYRDENYVEATTDTHTVALDHLGNPADGFLDGAHNKRDSFGADIVALFYYRDDDITSFCGQAFVGHPTPEEDEMFSVTAIDCIDFDTFSHELGHNFGCYHERESCGDDTVEFAHGFRDADLGYRSIMATSCPGGACPREQFFSNDDMAFEDKTNGAADADCARQHNENRAVVEAFRDEKPTCDSNIDCDDGNSTTFDVCDNGFCSNPSCLTDADCDDLNANTLIDVCDCGACRNYECATNDQCTDIYDCTTDTCALPGTCRHAWECTDPLIGLAKSIEPSSVTTPVQNENNGAYMQIEPSVDILITQFDIHTRNTSSIDVQVYYVAGDGYDLFPTPSAWIEHETVTVIGQGLGTLTPVPLSKPLFLAAKRYTIQIISYGGTDMQFSSGSSSISSVSNSEVTVFRGISVRFNGSGSAGYSFFRFWEGTIHYRCAIDQLDNEPSDSPSMPPSAIPSRQPSRSPSLSLEPSGFPSRAPSSGPSKSPSLSSSPSISPSRTPSSTPSKSPSESAEPSSNPSNKPTREGSEPPSVSLAPSRSPSLSMVPSTTPSTSPSREPSMSQKPSASPSKMPSFSIQPSTSLSPSSNPSSAPSNLPSESPSLSLEPSRMPSLSMAPSDAPSAEPSESPSDRPSSRPSREPSQSQEPSASPSKSPSSSPSKQPSNSIGPSSTPSSTPSKSPSVSQEPSSNPSNKPTMDGTAQPSVSLAPSTMPSLSMAPSNTPSASPSESPSDRPSNRPSLEPSSSPSQVPSLSPSELPSISMEPSNRPSAMPSVAPSNLPSVSPSGTPSMMPSQFPSNRPSAIPSVAPSSDPSVSPSGTPSTKPSQFPSISPSLSSGPSAVPSGRPSTFPSEPPSSGPTSSLSCINDPDWSFETKSGKKTRTCEWVGDKNVEERCLEVGTNGDNEIVPASEACPEFCVDACQPTPSPSTSPSLTASMAPSVSGAPSLSFYPTTGCMNNPDWSFLTKSGKKTRDCEWVGDREGEERAERCLEVGTIGDGEEIVAATEACPEFCSGRCQPTTFPSSSPSDMASMSPSLSAAPSASFSPSTGCMNNPEWSFLTKSGKKTRDCEWVGDREGEERAERCLEVGTIGDGEDIVTATEACPEFCSGRCQPTSFPSSSPSDMASMNPSMSAAPSVSLSPATACQNDPDWFFLTKSGKKTRGCEWVGDKDTEKRCQNDDEDGVSAVIGCPEFCDESCQLPLVDEDPGDGDCVDDASWFFYTKSGKKTRDCEWVADKDTDKRCKNFDHTGEVPAYDACCVCL